MACLIFGQRLLADSTRRRCRVLGAGKLLEAVPSTGYAGSILEDIRHRSVRRSRLPLLPFSADRLKLYNQGVSYSSIPLPFFATWLAFFREEQMRRNFKAKVDVLGEIHG